MMNKEKKKEYIKEMTTQFDKSEAVIVTHYQGLTVNQLDDLRNKMISPDFDSTILANFLTKGWIEKRKLSPAISNNLIDEGYANALSNGALGGKLLGAGGGGFLLLVVPEVDQVELLSHMPNFYNVSVKHEPLGSRLLSMLSD